MATSREPKHCLQALHCYWQGKPSIVLFLSAVLKLTQTAKISRIPIGESGGKRVSQM